MKSNMVKKNPAVKKIVVLLCGILLLISIVSIGKAALGTKTIGTISGLEYEKITIDDVIYEIDYNHHFSNKNKGKFLGIIRSGDDTFRIYSVKEDDSHQYLYRLWGYEGAFYKKK